MFAVHKARAIKEWLSQVIALTSTPSTISGMNWKMRKMNLFTVCETVTSLSYRRFIESVLSFWGVALFELLKVWVKFLGWEFWLLGIQVFPSFSEVISHVPKHRDLCGFSLIIASFNQISPVGRIVWLWFWQAAIKDLSAISLCVDLVESFPRRLEAVIETHQHISVVYINKYLM